MCREKQCFGTSLVQAEELLPPGEGCSTQAVPRQVLKRQKYYDTLFKFILVIGLTISSENISVPYWLL